MGNRPCKDVGKGIMNTTMQDSNTNRIIASVEGGISFTKAVRWVRVATTEEVENAYAMISYKAIAKKMVLLKLIEAETKARREKDGFFTAL